MTLLRHALSVRWLSYLALTLAFAVVSSLFGLWQWDRREAVVGEIGRVERNFDAPVVALEDLLGRSDPWQEDLKWRPVVVSGEYVSSEQLLVRTRPRFGSVGFDVVVPLRLADGTAVLVQRGWVPTGQTRDQPDVVPGAPPGRVEVVGRLMPGEPQIPGRTAPTGQVATIHLEEIAALTGIDLDTRFYLALEREQPGPAVTPLLVERPTLDEGPHLSYTFQWFLFGALGFVAWGYLLREDYRRAHGLSASPPKRADRSDQEVEDELLDRSVSSR